MPANQRAEMKAVLGLSDEYWGRLTEKDRLQYELVRPLPDAAYAADVAIARLEAFLDGQRKDLEGLGGGLELEPDFQRGHCWSDEQRMRYVESVIRGQAPTRLLFNCPNYSGGLYAGDGDIPAHRMQCIDGLQRATTLMSFARGEIKVFGDLTVDDFRKGPFDDRRYRVQFVVYQFEQRKSLLQFYLDLNGGGVVHSDEELNRVRGLLKAVEGGPIDLRHSPAMSDVRDPLASEPRRPRQRG